MNEAALENTDGLADNEITRLITLSNQARYSRSDIVPVSEPSPFEPKSLVEIAMAAQKRRDEANVHAAAEKAMVDKVDTVQGDQDSYSSEQGTAETSSENTDTADAVPAEGDLASGSENNPVMDASSKTASDSAMATDQPVDVAKDITKDNDATDGVVDVKAEQQDSVQSDQTDQTQPTPTTSNVPDPAILKAEYKRGQEAGLAEGQAKAAEQLEKVLQNFEQAVLALADPDALDISALSMKIASRVMAMASDRAGHAITDMPEPFAKRIEGLITMVKSETATPTINLNSEDFASIKPLVQNREKLKDCNFVVDATMTRGDVRLVVGGIGLVDQISDRTNMPISADEKTDVAESAGAISETTKTSNIDENAKETKSESDGPSLNLAEEAPTSGVDDNYDALTASNKDTAEVLVSAADDVSDNEISETEPEPEADPKPKAKAEPATEPEPKPKTKIKPKAKAEAEIEPKAEAKATDDKNGDAGET